MSSDLLPINATAQERALAIVAQSSSDLPVPVRMVWDPDTCPTDLLPWLAWAFSVDFWDTSWTETQKRQVVRDSLYIHKHKGTIGAIRRALSAIGYSFRVVEWFEQVPTGPHHTFQVHVGVTDVGMTEQTYDSVLQIIRDAKNVRSQLTALVVSGDVLGKLLVGAATISGDDCCVRPYENSLLEQMGLLSLAAGLVTGERVYVYPENVPTDYEWDGETGAINPAAFTLPDGTYPDGGIGPIDQGEYSIADAEG